MEELPDDVRSGDEEMYQLFQNVPSLGNEEVEGNENDETRKSVVCPSVDIPTGGKIRKATLVSLLNQGTDLSAHRYDFKFNNSSLPVFRVVPGFTARKKQSRWTLKVLPPHAI